jgi:hypothetical protein
MGRRMTVQEKFRHSRRPVWRMVRWIVRDVGGLERARLLMMLWIVGLAAVLLVLLLILGEQFYVAPVARR